MLVTTRSYIIGENIVRKIIFTLFLFSQICSSIIKQKLLDKTVLAHRGLWGYFPEHAIRGFELAYFMNADYLETDINMTKDGYLIVFHDAYLDDTTNVNEFKEFQSRRKSAIVDGLPVLNKLFISDFTLEEINKLFLSQRNLLRPQNYNREFKVVLLEDLIKMTIQNNKIYNKSTGIYVEPKSVDYYLRLTGINLNQKVLNLLKRYNLTNMDDKVNYSKCPIVIESFEFETLVFFKHKTNLPQVALMRWRQLYDLNKLAEYSDGFGPDVDFVLYERVDNLLTANKTKFDNQQDFKEKVLNNPFKESIEDLGERILKMNKNLFIQYAKQLGKHVQVWNVNNDAPKFSRDPSIEYAKMTQIGVNAFFADFCDNALFGMKHYKKLLE